MKSTLKRALALLLVCVMALALVSCGKSGSQSSGKDQAGASTSSGSQTDSDKQSDSGSKTENTKKHKIMVFTISSSSTMIDAISGFLGSIADELNFEYDVRYKGADASEYLSKVETAISEGYEGIITMKDEGNTNEIVALCEENGVYFGNTWNNQGSSLNTSAAGYAFLESPYFVGGVVDCTDSMSVEGAAYCKAVAEAYEKLPADKKEGSIGFVTMPPAWQPTQVPAVQTMYETLLDEYNIPESAFAVNGLEKRTEEMRYAGTPVAAGTYIWPSMDATSKKLESKYFDENPNMSLLISTLAYTFINSGLDSANKLTSMKVWCTGFDNADALINNFGTKGNGTYQGCRTAPIECIAMPLVQILDKLNGYSYADKEGAIKGFGPMDDTNKFKYKGLQLKSSPTIVILNDEEMDAYLNHNVYGTGKGEDSVIDAEFLKQYMVTFNSDATYEQLCEAFGENSTAMSMEAILAKAGK
ncbi:MAG: hypothetical protein ACI3XJ_08890 [Oscillospiraceae bacterium]